MCCFTRAVPFVGATKIFARGLPEGRQGLAYSMNVRFEEPLAMALPLPVPPRPSEDEVTFINLDGYDNFFSDLQNAFPPVFGPLSPQSRSFGAPPPRKLVVHDVGQFVASFVPTVADFGRLDPRFRLPDTFFSALPRYLDWGFAVFQLKPNASWLGNAKTQTIHPMAMSFPRRDPRALFFPTVHMHDGSVPARAKFDHSLYAQDDGLLEATVDWPRSSGPLGTYVAANRTQGLVDGERSGFMNVLVGEMDNDDIVLCPPNGVTPSDLAGEGVCFRYGVRAGHAYALGLLDARRSQWNQTARTKLPALCRGLSVGLAELVRARREAWRLAPLTDALPPHFINGTYLWTGTSYMDGAPAQPGGPGLVRFTPFSDQVEPQSVTFGFAELPDPETVHEIIAALRELLDRAVD